jgi:hypothetical protein
VVISTKHWFYFLTVVILISLRLDFRRNVLPYLMLPYVDSACSSCLGSIGSSSSSFLLTILYDGRVTEGMLDISRSHITRGNALKLVKHRSRRDIRKYSFTNRIVDLGNSLPNHIVEAKTMFQFEHAVHVVILSIWNF